LKSESGVKSDSSVQIEPHLVNIPTYLHDPAVTEDAEAAVNATLVIEGVASTSKRNALLQAVYTLLVLTKDDARAPASNTTCPPEMK
jgi:hypothetical protein